jgi:ABC transporter substrate binding protein
MPLVQVRQKALTAFWCVAGKRIELLREVVPALRRLAILANAGNPVTLLDMREVEAAARTLGLTVVTVEIRRMEDTAPVRRNLTVARTRCARSAPKPRSNPIRINTLGALRAAADDAQCAASEFLSDDTDVTL